MNRQLHFVYSIYAPPRGFIVGLAISLRSLKRRLMRRIGLMPPKYKSFVSHAGDYDSLGRSQFDLLRFFGLAPDSYLLDIGCGSLNCGRFAISMLEVGHYYGLEYADIPWPHPRQSWVVFYRPGRAAFVDERARAAAAANGMIPKPRPS